MNADRNRTRTIVLTGTLALIATGLAAAAGVSGEWAADAEPDPVELSERLENERVASLARMELNQRLLYDLVSGRCTLAEAVDLHVQINQSGPQVGDYLRLRFPDAADDRERMLLSLVDTVEAFAESHPDQYSDVVSRVHKDLAAMTVRVH